MDTAIAIFIILIAVAVLARRAYRTFRKPSDCGCAGCGCPSKSVSEACNPSDPFENYSESKKRTP